MIRINLLGTPKAKNKRGASSAMPTMEVGDAGSPKMKVLVVLALAAALNLTYWYRLDKEKQSIATRCRKPSRRTGSWPT